LYLQRKWHLFYAEKNLTWRVKLEKKKTQNLEALIFNWLKASCHVVSYKPCWLMFWLFSAERWDFKNEPTWIYSRTAEQTFEQIQEKNL
jgi:hypothetical protein